MSIEIRTVSMDTLTEDPNNVRKHNDRNIAAIADSLEKFGQRRPLVITKENVIVAGNGTYRAARQLGWKQVDVTTLPFEEEHLVKAFAIADNRTSELAEWDGIALLESLKELGDVPGFMVEDIDDLEAVWGATPSLQDVQDAVAGADEGEALWPVLSFRVPKALMAAWRAHVETENTDDAHALAIALQLDWEDVAR